MYILFAKCFKFVVICFTDKAKVENAVFALAQFVILLHLKQQVVTAHVSGRFGDESCPAHY